MKEKLKMLMYNKPSEMEMSLSNQPLKDIDHSIGIAPVVEENSHYSMNTEDKKDHVE